MSLSKVESALVKAYTDGAFFAANRTQFENIAFTPPTGEAWGAFYFVPSQPDVSTLGEAGFDRLDGFVQVDLNFPANVGTSTAKAKADALRIVFKAGERFWYEGQEVTIRSCGRSQGRIVNGLYRISVTIVFYAQVARSGDYNPAPSGDGWEELALRSWAEVEAL